MHPGTLSTPLTELLGISLPILLAPMGDSAGGRLAAAVSDAGGLGLIGGGYADPHWLETEIHNAGNARVGVGFITFALDERPQVLRQALAAQPVAVQLAFGDPRPYGDDIHHHGAYLICGVQAPHEIELALEAGADIIVAQGRDAGGHGRPDRGLMGLVPSVVDAVDPIPVVAAGAIADGRGLAAALMLGAAGVSVGTRLLASHEAISTPDEAARLVAGRSHHTLRTDIFDIVRGPAWPHGHDGRALRNRLVDDWETGAEIPALTEMYAAGNDPSLTPVWAGEGLDQITSIEPARDIIEAIASDALLALASARLLAPGHD